MKPKLMLTIAGVFYLLDGFAGFFMASDFDYFAYVTGIFTMSLGLLFLLTRQEVNPSVLKAILLTGFLSSFGVGLIGVYSQWSGHFMDSPIGYLPPALWLLVGVGFFLTGRANQAAAAA